MKNVLHPKMYKVTYGAFYFGEKVKYILNFMQDGCIIARQRHDLSVS
jgi:hypothetical protein